MLLRIQLGTQRTIAQACHFKLHYGENIRFGALGETAGLEAGQSMEHSTDQQLQ